MCQPLQQVLCHHVQFQNSYPSCCLGPPRGLSPAWISQARTEKGAGASVWLLCLAVCTRSGEISGSPSCPVRHKEEHLACKQGWRLGISCQEVPSGESLRKEKPYSSVFSGLVTRHWPRRLPEGDPSTLPIHPFSPLWLVQIPIALFKLARP